MVTLKSDGPAALAELADSQGIYEVIFSDVVMPGMSGIEMGEEIRFLYGHLPVVLTSGYSHVLAENGTHGFELLHKPYSMEQLSLVLHKDAAWRHNQLLNDEAVHSQELPSTVKSSFYKASGTSPCE